MTDDNEFKTLYEAGAVDRGELITGRRSAKMMYYLKNISNEMEAQTELMREQTELLQVMVDNDTRTQDVSEE